MRIGEILKLEWKNIDFEQDILYIVESESGRGRDTY